MTSQLNVEDLNRVAVLRGLLKRSSVAAWLCDLPVCEHVDGQLPAGRGELYETCRRQNEVATLAPKRLRIDINSTGVTPPIEFCNHRTARVDEHVGIFVMLTPAKPLHPVRAQSERAGWCVEAHVHRANDASYQSGRQFIVEGDMLAYPDSDGKGGIALVKVFPVSLCRWCSKSVEAML